MPYQPATETSASPIAHGAFMLAVTRRVTQNVGGPPAKSTTYTRQNSVSTTIDTSATAALVGNRPPPGSRPKAPSERQPRSSTDNANQGRPGYVPRSYARPTRIHRPPHSSTWRLKCTRTARTRRVRRVASLSPGLPHCVPRHPRSSPHNTADQLRSGAPVHPAGGGTGRHLRSPFGCRPELRQLHPLVRRRSHTTP